MHSSFSLASLEQDDDALFKRQRLAGEDFRAENFLAVASLMGIRNNAWQKAAAVYNGQVTTSERKVRNPFRRPRPFLTQLSGLSTGCQQKLAINSLAEKLTAER
jgi:hypothetical protein